MLGIQVRKFNFSRDYNTFCKWRDEWELDRIPEIILPPTGYVAYRGTLDLCMGFVYKTDSCVAIFEHGLINKKATVEEKNNLFIKLGDVMLRDVKEMGFDVVWLCFQDLLLEGSEIQKRITKLADEKVENITIYHKLLK